MDSSSQSPKGVFEGGYVHIRTYSGRPLSLLGITLADDHLSDVDDAHARVLHLDRRLGPALDDLPMMASRPPRRKARGRQPRTRIRLARHRYLHSTDLIAIV